MIPLRVPNRTVFPEDFQGRLGVCQNLDCLAPIEPPYQTASLCFPGGTLTTVLCSRCMPPPWDGRVPELHFQVVAANPVLALPDPGGIAVPGPGIVPASQFQLRSLSQPLPPHSAEQTGVDSLTFADLAQLAPRLQDLLAEARSHHTDPNPNFCANAVWYGYADVRLSLRSRLVALVGHLAKQEGIIRTSRAYDVAYNTFYQALPDCRGRCACSFGLGSE